MIQPRYSDTALSVSPATVSPAAQAPGTRRHALTLLAGGLLAALAGCGTVGEGGPAPEGYYRVRSGDTLYSIARRHRRSVRQLAQWNNLPSADRIETGQLIRVRPPVGAAAASSSASSSGSSAASSAADSGAPAKVTDTPRTASSSSRPPSSRIALRWPADGAVTQGYAPPASKGIRIAVPARGTVRAAASGRTIHVGNLRGYGTLVIVKHSDDWLTVYGNLDQTTIQEGVQVEAGQVVGRMGAAASELHFEVRGNGKPVDPAGLLPSRG